jgi:hypothetical protein
MRNRHSLLATTQMTPAERAAGRFMRAPDHPMGGDGSDDGNDSTQNSDNGTGNSGDSVNTGEPKDNASQPDPTKGFWEAKPEDAPADDDDESGKNLGTELNGIIKSTQFSPLFNKEIAEKIAEGDFDSANIAFHEATRQAMAQNIALTAKVVSAYGDRMMKRVEALVNEKLGGMQNEDVLLKEFPAAADPTVRPMIQSVFDQALVVNKGDRKKAVAMTKQMINTFGDKTGLRTPPTDPSGAPPMNDSAKSLVEDLLDRG